MNAVREVLGFVVFLYFLVLIGRVVFDWIRIFAKEWRPRGAALLVAEPIYTLTEPPLRALRKVIPPLRLGGVSLDLSFMVLFFIVYILLIVLAGGRRSRSVTSPDPDPACRAVRGCWGLGLDPMSPHRS